MKLRIASPLFVLAMCSVSMAQYQYFTPSASISTPYSVSNNGVAVGIASSQVALWKPLLSGTPTTIGGLNSGTPKISADGMFVSGNSPGGDGKSEMSRYSAASGTWTPLGGAGGYSGTTRSSAWGVSGDGSTVFGFGYGTYTGTGTGTYTGIRPMSVKNGVMTDYSIIQNASSINRIQASSFDGSIVAGRARYTTALDGTFFWNNGVRNDMLFNGSYLGSPEAMSDDGTFIAGSGSDTTGGTQGGFYHRLPYLYNSFTGNTTVIDSIAGINGNTIPGDTTRIDGLVTGMSGDGSVVVGFFRRTSPNIFVDKTWGFIWTAGTGVRTFDSFAESNGIAATANNYLIPTGISQDGRTFVGYTMQKVGAPTGTAFMMTSVPEPGTIAALGLGIAALLRRRKQSS